MKERGEDLRFLHLADLHLEEPNLVTKAPGLRQRVKEATEEALERATTFAIEEKLDAVLIAGDLYHTAERSIAQFKRLDRSFRRLEEAGIPVFLLHGNHDYVTQEDWAQMWPSTVLVFGQDVETKYLTTAACERVALSGFSYGTRWISQDRIGEFPPKDAQVDYHIGLMHAAEATGDTDQDHYAPFHLKDLLDKGYDYWALGHIHHRQRLNERPPVVYPGNLQGRHRKEAGEKGGYLVELTPGKAELTFVRFSPLCFSPVTYQARRVDSLQLALEDFRQFIQKEQEAVDGEVALDVTFVFAEDFKGEIQQAIKSLDLYEYFSDCYLAKVSFKEQGNVELPLDPDLAEDLKEVPQTATWDSLYQAAIGRLYSDRNLQQLQLLDLLDDEFEQEVKLAAKRDLLEEELGGK